MLRNLEQTDIPQLVAIETAVHVMPWTALLFQYCLRAGYLGWVYADKQAVYAYILISFNAGECHILNLGVAKAYQRQGYATRLIEHVLQFAKEQNAILAYLEVRRSNAEAIALYYKLNFTLTGERKNYYPPFGLRDAEDALVFVKELG